MDVSNSIPLFPMSSTPPPTSFHPSPYSLSAPRWPEMESVEGVEKLLNYNFKNKALLKEALTFNSHSYQRFELLGDSAIGLALTNFLYLTYPKLKPGDLSPLRAANVSTEKFARLALTHGLYPFLLQKTPELDARVNEFAEAVKKEDESAVYGGLVKAPKFLADLFESVAGAIYVDVNFNLEEFWLIYKAFLEPMFTLEDMQRLPEPIGMLFRMCHKLEKEVNIKFTYDAKRFTASVYLDDDLFATGRAEDKYFAKLIAAKEAVKKLLEIIPVDMDTDKNHEDVAPDHAKQKLNQICIKKMWPRPIYSVEEVDGVNQKRYVCAATINTEAGTLYMKGDEMSRKTEAERSTAYHMIRALRHGNYLE